MGLTAVSLATSGIINVPRYFTQRSTLVIIRAFTVGMSPESLGLLIASGEMYRLKSSAGRLMPAMFAMLFTGLLRL